MGVVVIPRVIFRLMASAFASASPDALMPLPPGSCGTLRAATESQSFAHPLRCLVRPLSGLSRQQRDRLLRAQPGTRRSADVATSSRLRHAPQATAPVCTRLLPQGSPVGFIRRMQMTTTRPSQGLVSSGLVALGLLTRSRQARLALSGPAGAGSIQDFPKALYCLAIPDGLALKGCASHRLHRASRHSMLPRPSPKSLRQFHLTNRVNGIRLSAFRFLAQKLR
jgi:hypothetical protein